MNWKVRFVIAVGFINFEFWNPVNYLHLTASAGDTSAARIYAVFFITIGLLELPSGLIADIIGHKKSCWIGSVMCAAFPVLIIFSTTGWSYLAGMLLLAAGTSLISGADRAFLFENLERTEGSSSYLQWAARTSFVAFASLATATFVGGLLYSWLPLAPYGGYLLASALAVVLFGTLPVGDRQFVTVRQSVDHVGSLLTGAMLQLKRWWLRPIVFSMACIEGLAYSTFVYSQLVIVEGGLSVASLGIILGGVELVNACISFIVSRLHSHVAKMRYFIFCVTVTFLCFAIFFYVESVLRLFPFYLGMASAMFVKLCGEAMVQGEIEGGGRATVLSWINTLGTIFAAAITLVYVQMNV